MTWPSDTRELDLREAGDAQTAPARLLALASHPGPEVRRLVAANPLCPPDALERLRHDPAIAVRATALVHPASRAAQPADAPALSLSFSKRERVNLASDHDSPAPLLTALADDPEVEVRWQVVMHNRCPPGAMERLARDEDPEIRRLLVAHRECPASIFQRLSSDPVSIVRESVVRGVSCPFGVRLALVRDPDPRVQQAALAQPAAFTQLVERLLREGDDRDLWPTLLQHRNADARVLDQLAHNASISVRRLVAASPRCSSDTLARLSGDDDLAVRQAVAQNPSSSPLSLWDLTDDPDPDVRALVARHPSCTPEMRERLARASGARAPASTDGHMDDPDTRARGAEAGPDAPERTAAAPAPVDPPSAARPLLDRARGRQLGLAVALGVLLVVLLTLLWHRLRGA